MVRRTKAGAAPNPLRGREVARLAKEFRAARREFLGDAVAAVVEMGRILIRGRKKTKGRYYEWLDELGVSPPTAHNYESLALFFAENPDLVDDWRALGPSKLYRVVDMTPEGRRALLRSSDAPRLERMIDADFKVLTEPYVESRVPVTPDMTGHGFHMKVVAWLESAREARVGAIKSAKIRGDLKADLRRLRAALKSIEASL